MEAATWLAVAVLGPGALFIFAWFLRDLVDIAGWRRRKRRRRG